jgi:phosphatidate phosphatase APP1
LRSHSTKDPRQQTFSLREADGTPKLSDLNGLIIGELRLTRARGQELLKAQGSNQGWLRLHVVSPGHRGDGRIRLIEHEGLSVISDIDDTIKVTDIPAGGEVVIENTFYRPFVAIPGMAERYRRLGEETAFHYVSGGSWQLYRPLAGFIAAAGFPEGSFHMKSVRKNLLTPGSWQDLWNLARGDATVEQKLGQISEIIGHFPRRRFILVGDSGEHDPEIYQEVRNRFPRQIEAVWIRDLVDDRHRNPERLKRIEIIDAQ